VAIVPSCSGAAASAALSNQSVDGARRRVRRQRQDGGRGGQGGGVRIAGGLGRNGVRMPDSRVSGIRRCGAGPTGVPVACRGLPTPPAGSGCHLPVRGGRNPLMRVIRSLDAAQFEACGWPELLHPVGDGPRFVTPDYLLDSSGTTGNQWFFRSRIQVAVHCDVLALRIEPADGHQR